MPFKESKEGQTHSQNDGCGEPEHNDMKSHKEIAQAIIKTLNTEISDSGERINRVSPDVRISDINAYLITEISKALKEAEDRSEIKGARGCALAMQMERRYGNSKHFIDTANEYVKSLEEKV